MSNEHSSSIYVGRDDCVDAESYLFGVLAAAGVAD